MPETAELYATYLEVTIPHNSGVDRRRLQWVVLPNLPERLAPGSSPATEHLSFFSREQDKATHRAVWRYTVDTNGNAAQTIARRVDAYVNAGWSLTPIITCEVHPTEMAAIIKEPKTPYRILQRLQKVARRKYGIDIS